jgi:hypothetical protein
MTLLFCAMLALVLGVSTWAALCLYDDITAKDHDREALLLSAQLVEDFNNLGRR